MIFYSPDWDDITTISFLWDRFSFKIESMFKNDDLENYFV